jgi:hypothetical protein
LFAATLNQGILIETTDFWNIGSIEIYILYFDAGAAGMLLHINGQFKMENVNVCS